MSELNIAEQRAAIDAFWAWWINVRDEIVKAIDAQDIDPFVDPLMARVRAISPRLVWELGAGANAKYQLCVTGEGDARARLCAERWLAAAPDADDTWEHVAARQPRDVPDLLLKIGDVELDLEAFRFAARVDEVCELVDVGVFHPAFAEVESADEQCATATFLYLEQLLGEDGVARWLGFVDVYHEPIDEAVLGGVELRDVVGQLESSATGRRWVTLRGEVDGQPGELEANVALKRIDHLLLDTRIELSIMLEDDVDGMPTQEEADALGAIEAEVLAAVGDHAVLLGRETHSGERVLHLQAAADGPALAAVDAVVEAHDDRAIGVETAHDPTWEQLALWRDEARAPS